MPVNASLRLLKQEPSPLWCRLTVSEPDETSIRTVKARSSLAERLDSEMRELSRSKPYQALVAQAKGISQLLVESADKLEGLLDRTIQHVLDCASIIPLDRAAIARGLAVRTVPRLSPQDALVYGSILEDLQTRSNEPKCFLTRNAKDFDNTPIKQTLSQFNCRLIVHFDQALAYIENQLRSGNASSQSEKAP